MKLETIKPAKSLNKAYFKQSITREQIEIFKAELQKAFHHIDEKQDEEHTQIITSIVMSSRKLKVKISKELLEELERIQVRFKLN